MPNGRVECGHGKLAADALALYLVPACSERWPCDEQCRGDADENESLHGCIPLMAFNTRLLAAGNVEERGVAPPNWRSCGHALGRVFRNCVLRGVPIKTN